MIAARPAPFDAARHMPGAPLHTAGIAAADTAISKRYLFSIAAAAKQPSSIRHGEIPMA